MMKSIKMLVISLMMLNSSIHAMNSTSSMDQTRITFLLGDGKKREIDYQIATRSEMITMLIEDLGMDSQIYLPSMSGDVFDVCLQDVDDPQSYVEQLDVEALRMLIFGANYLEIPDLLDEALLEYVDRITSEETLEMFKHDTTLFFARYLCFPDEIKDAIAQKIVQICEFDLWILGQPGLKPMKSLIGHGDKVLSVKFSPDGKTVVSGYVDGSIILWDVQTGDCIRILEGHEEGVYLVCFSFDGQEIVSASYDGNIKIWDVHSGDCLVTLSPSRRGVSGLCTSPNNKTIAFATVEPGAIKTCNMEQPDNDSGLLFGYHDKQINSLCFSPDGSLLVSGSSDGSLKLWDMATRECIKIFEEKGSIDSVDFSPDGQMLALRSGSKSLKVYEMEKYECVMDWVGHRRPEGAVKFSPDGRMMAFDSSDRTVTLLDFSTGECINQLANLCCLEGAIDFSPDGKMLVSGSHHPKIWDLSTPYLHKLSLEQALLLAVIRYNSNENKLDCLSNPLLKKIFDGLPRELLGRIVPKSTFSNCCMQ